VFIKSIDYKNDRIVVIAPKTSQMDIEFPFIHDNSKSMFNVDINHTFSSLATKLSEI